MRVAVVPGLPALLPSYAGLIDPVPELREACLDAVAWLVEGVSSVTVLGDPLSPDDVARGVTVSLTDRIASALLEPHGVSTSSTDVRGLSLSLSPVEPVETILVVANGTARRSEKAPGHLDERSFGYDDALGAALATGDVAALRGLDAELGAELLAAGVSALQELPALSWQSTIDWAGDPFGVQYWVVRWQSGS